MAESREFRAMLESKERELIALCDQQIQSLNGQIREKERAVAELKDQMSQLQDDFKYNLGLLDARDAELAQYDISSAALEASVKESEERLNVTRKALADAQTLRVQEKARADELEQISQQKISDLEKEIDGLLRSKEELQANAKHELEATKSELKDLQAEKLEALEEEHKKDMDEATRKWKEKIAKAEARLAESVEDLEAAEKRIESADEKCKNLKKELEAAKVSQKEDADAASRRESQNSLKEAELKLLLDKQAKEIEALNKQLNQLKENKDANVQAGDPSSNLKEQLQDLKAHHAAAVDLFKGEIDSLRNKLESTASQILNTRNLEAEIGRLRKEIEEKVREQKELGEKLNELHSSYRDLQTELAGNKQHEGMLPQGLGLPGGGSGSASSYPAPSPLLSPGLSNDDAVRINQGKLEAENSQLRARCQELSLQNDRMRDAVGTMRLEMESLQRRTKTPSRSPSPSPIKKRAGVRHLREEVKNLKSQVQDMADELGELRVGSPNVHFRRPPQRQSNSPKRSGVSPERRPKSSAKMQSSSHSRSSRSPPRAVRSSSPNSPRGGGIDDRAPEVEIVNLSLRAQLEAAKADMARIIKERDLLMELSNALRADLSKIVQSGAREYAHNPHFDYSAVPPSLTAQFQQEFEPGTVPKNSKLMAGMSSSHDVAHAARPRTISPGKTRFRSDARATEPSLKPWGFGVGHGETREVPEVMGLQLEGTPYLHERPQGVDTDPLHKGTNSQRARLKAAMKRKDDLNRPRARNWNIKDDHPFET